MKIRPLLSGPVVQAYCLAAWLRHQVSGSKVRCTGATSEHSTAYLPQVTQTKTCYPVKHTASCVDEYKHH
eukprot:jgi/Chrzof1/7591/Cz02g29130.t1